MRRRLAWWLRCWADRLDRPGAPKITHWTFTFERGKGLVFREDGKGCQVAYLGDDEYEKAHTESDTAAADAKRRADLQALVDDMAATAAQAGKQLGKVFAAMTNAVDPLAALTGYVSKDRGQR
jgi:hypothetical protein